MIHDKRFCFLLSAVLLLAALPLRVALAGDAMVTLYEDKNYGGKEVRITEDVPNLGSSMTSSSYSSYYFDEITSSVKLEGIKSVALFEHTDYRGNCETLKKSVTDLKQIGALNDRVSSLKLNAECDDEGPAIILYKNVRYGGEHVTVLEDAADLDVSPPGPTGFDAISSPPKIPDYKFDNKTSSIKLRNVASVAAYADLDFQGACETIKREVADMKDTAVGNDRLSSVKLNAECSSDPAVILYKNNNFKGDTYRVQDAAADLGSVKFSNTASSLQLVGGASSAAVWDGPNYSGQCEQFTADVPDLKKSEIGNDTIDSVKVNATCMPDGESLTLFEDNNYRGKAVYITRDVDDLGDYKFNDKASSLQLNEVRSVAVYEDAHYFGACQDFTANASSMSGRSVGNDKISSVRLDARCKDYKLLTIKNRAAMNIVADGVVYLATANDAADGKLAGGQTEQFSMPVNTDVVVQIYKQDITVDLSEQKIDVLGLDKICTYLVKMSEDIEITVTGTTKVNSCDIKHVY